MVLITDETYHFSCWLKSSIEGHFPSQGSISGTCDCTPDTTTTTTTTPSNPSGSCCQNLYFSSTGPLAESGQSHVLGYYTKLSDGPGDYWNYQQTENIYGHKRKLWYSPSLKAWWIGDHLGSCIAKYKTQIS